MFDRTMYLGVFLLYTALMGVLLVEYDANGVVVALVLSAAPIALLWHAEQLRTSILPTIVAVALGAILLIEVVAYINGLWYELSPWDIRLFGLVPLESLLASFAHILLFIVAYEFWFDDRKTTTEEQPHLSYGLAGAGALVALAVAYVHVFSGVLFTYPFALLILLGFVLFFVLVALAHRAFVAVLKKAALFAAAVFPVSLVYEYVILSNELRFLANHNEYLYNFMFFGQRLPIEEIILILVMPFWVAVVYELYLDDAE